MKDISVIGIGQTSVAEHWETSLRHLAFNAVQAAFHDAGIERVGALFVGNMLAGELSHQEHLGALLADFTGLRGIEAVRVEAADASGGAALRQAYLAVASGAVDFAMALGVEKITDVVGNGRLAALATSMDADYEGAQGATPAALAALLMRRYMPEYGVEVQDFAGFSVNAHANGALNPNAMYRNRLKPESFARAPQVAPPINLFDAAPEGDGAAVLILTTTERAKDLVPRPVRIAASAVATDTLSVHDRPDPLFSPPRTSPPVGLMSKPGSARVMLMSSNCMTASPSSQHWCSKPAASPIAVRATHSPTRKASGGMGESRSRPSAD